MFQDLRGLLMIAVLFKAVVVLRVEMIDRERMVTSRLRDRRQLDGKL